jgi:4-aminobutyrate--pyruvate transaminase
VADRASRQPFDPVGRVGAHVAQRCQAHGLILRAIGDTIAICPPLIVDEKQISTIVDTLGRALDEIQAALSRDAN